MTDQELVELFWQRREEALTGLQDKYGGWCRSIAGRILGEERDVEECLGDCWLQLWNAIPPARPQHFRGYLGAVVRNRALLIRRRRGRQGDTVSLAALELAECLPSREGPEEQAEAAELGRAISAFLRELGEVRRHRGGDRRAPGLVAVQDQERPVSDAEEAESLFGTGGNVVNRGERMMEAVGLVDPALVEQAAGPARRHSARRPLRTGLIAACLCAALLGSAWAANQIGGFQSLKFFEDLLLPAELSDDGEALGEAHYDGYTLEGGIDFLALEDLPQEALDMAAEHPASTVRLDLTSWEEAEAYFGLELPENAYLQEQLQSGFRAALSSDSEGPTALEWTAEYLDSGVRLEVWVTAYTQRMELPDHPVSQSHLLPSDTQYTTEEHTAPNGLSAVMTTVEQGPEDPYYDKWGARMFRADFALGGVWYRVDAYDRAEPQRAREALEELLNGFML